MVLGASSDIKMETKVSSKTFLARSSIDLSETYGIPRHISSGRTPEEDCSSMFAKKIRSGDRGCGRLPSPAISSEQIFFRGTSSNH
jgi:hypothetical protein